jgi:O-antigen/teichoic acid export membrane protein
VRSPDRANLTGGHLLARNTLLNIAGEAAPLLLGLISIPIVVRELGADRYGVLALSYLVVGYLSLFDLGLGRAATQQIGEAIGAGETGKIPSIFWTSTILIFAVGLCAAALVMIAAHSLAYKVLNIPLLLRPQSEAVLIILGGALPFVLSGSCIYGTLTSFQRFDLINTVGALNGIYSLLAPLAVLLFTRNLIWIVGFVVAGRLAAWCVNLTLCLRLVPGLAANVRLSRSLIRPLLAFGGWITVTGITGPLMVYFDRFLIASLLSIGAVAYYSVPYAIVSKLPLLPGAMASVLFPALSATVRSDPKRAAILFERSSRYTLLALFPGALLLCLFSKEILTIFFGVTFTNHGSAAMRWLVFGVFMNGLAYIPYGLIQAANRPDLTAKFHVAEAPFYFVALFLLLRHFGVAGAAAAWTLRAAVDAALLFAAAAIILPRTRAIIGRITYLAVSAATIVAGGTLLPGLDGRIIYAALALTIYAAAGWYRLLDAGERAMIMHRLYSFRFKDWRQAA